MPDLSNFIPYKLHCIYILQRGKKSEYRIGYTLNSSRLIKQANTTGWESVYLRKFDHLDEAMGHKLFLEKVSIPSIKRIIKEYQKFIIYNS